MIKPSTELIAASVLVAAETAHVFSQFEPSVFTIKRLVVPQGQETDVRIGYIPALAIGLSVATVTTVIFKSPLPLIFALAVAAFTIGVYEYAIRSAQNSGSFSSVGY